MDDPITRKQLSRNQCSWGSEYFTGGILKVRMSVVRAKIQTVEDMYRLLWTAIATKQPVSAIYKDRPRLFCPHRLGRNRQGERRVLCYQYGGESESGLATIGSPENWRCVVFEKLRQVELLKDSWRTAPNHSRPATCVVEAEIDAEDQPEVSCRLGIGQ
ncbi:MAG TPA: hypothetical protein VH639_00680 [Bryobacteraceae bacterium]|jgi:hypothetical protein